MSTEPQQLTLDLEFTVPESYQIELRRDDESAPENLSSVVRHHEASNPEDALAFVEALRDDSKVRYSVTWQTEEPVQSGKMFGLAPGGVGYVIAVVPPLELV
jgi:hypothetical protein